MVISLIAHATPPRDPALLLGVRGISFMFAIFGSPPPAPRGPARRGGGFGFHPSPIFWGGGDRGQCTYKFQCIPGSPNPKRSGPRLVRTPRRPPNAHGAAHIGHLQGHQPQDGDLEHRAIVCIIASVHAAAHYAALQLGNLSPMADGHLLDSARDPSTRPCPAARGKGNFLHVCDFRISPSGA